MVVKLLLVSCHDPPIPSNTIADTMDMPPVSIVQADRPLKVIVPVPEYAKLVAGFVQLPATSIVDVPIASVIAPSRADAPEPNVTLPQIAVDAVTVNAPVVVFELLSKTTVSSRLGTAILPVPPDVIAQFVLEVLLQVPLLPLQYSV